MANNRDETVETDDPLTRQIEQFFLERILPQIGEAARAEAAAAAQGYIEQIDAARTSLEKEVGEKLGVLEQGARQLGEQAGQSAGSLQEAVRQLVQDLRDESKAIGSGLAADAGIFRHQALEIVRTACAELTGTTEHLTGTGATLAKATESLKAAIDRQVTQVDRLEKETMRAIVEADAADKHAAVEGSRADSATQAMHALQADAGEARGERDRLYGRVEEIEERLAKAIEALGTGLTQLETTEKLIGTAWLAIEARMALPAAAEAGQASDAEVAGGSLDVAANELDAERVAAHTVAAQADGHSTEDLVDSQDAEPVVATPAPDIGGTAEADVTGEAFASHATGTARDLLSRVWAWFGIDFSSGLLRPALLVLGIFVAGATLVFATTPRSAPSKPDTPAPPVKFVDEQPPAYWPIHARAHPGLGLCRGDTCDTFKRAWFVGQSSKSLAQQQLRIMQSVANAYSARFCPKAFNALQISGVWDEATVAAVKSDCLRDHQKPVFKDKVSFVRLRSFTMSMLVALSAPASGK